MLLVQDTNFNNYSTSHKNSLSEELRNSDSIPEIEAYSAAHKYAEQGNKDAAIVLKDIA